MSRKCRAFDSPWPARIGPPFRRFRHPSAYAAAAFCHQGRSGRLFLDQQAALAAQHGATALLAGHIFPTQCKAGLQPRGLSFLQEVLAVSPLPVWAIGGIHQATLPLLVTTGCAGACMMSEWMNGHPIP